MNLFNMIKFIGSKNPKYKWENIINYLPSKPFDGKAYLDNNDNRQGKWVSRYDYGNGKLVNIGTYSDDKKFGEFLEYFNGKLYSKGSYINGKEDGVWEYYNPVTELLVEKGSYNNGNIEGIWEYYYENGKLKSKGLYNNNNKKDGIWESYHKNGDLTSKELYNNGMFVKTITDYESI